MERYNIVFPGCETEKDSMAPENSSHIKSHCSHQHMTFLNFKKEGSKDVELSNAAVHMTCVLHVYTGSTGYIEHNISASSVGMERSEQHR